MKKGKGFKRGQRLGKKARSAWANLSRRRKRFRERAKRLGVSFALEAIARWEAERRISDQEAESLKSKLSEGYLSAFLTNFGIHLAISGVPVVMAGVGSIARPAYTIAARAKAASRRYITKTMSREEYEKIRRLHSGLAILFGTVPLVGRAAYPVSLLVHEPKLMRILLDHMTYKTLGEKLYKKFIGRKRAKSIAVIGIDGAGKTTLTRKLKAVLREKGLESIVINPPYYSEIESRPFAFFSSVSQKLIQIADRRNLLFLGILGASIGSLPFRRAVKAQRRKDMLLIERHPALEAFSLSNAMPSKAIRRVTRAAARAVFGRLPEVIVFIDIKPEEALKRIKKHMQKSAKTKRFQYETRIENLQKFAELYANAIETIRQEYPFIEVITVDGTKPPEEIVKELKEKLQRVINR
ncbi:MAG: hypothetical protein J7L44_00460 [Candidatus Diapherotrites archaeon]|nr:hypothetical protein [Candidatus Diapherotrites archaeon]